MARVIFSNTTKRAPTVAPLLRIAKAILPKNYELSVTFIGEKKSQSLNARFRGKDYPTNVLSFSLAKEAGEIYLTLPIIKKECRAFGMQESQFTAYLLIHGLLHLKGLAHGGTMDTLERTWCRKFTIPYPSASS